MQNILFDMKHSVCLLYVRDGKDEQGGAYLPPFLTQFTFHLEWFLDKSIIWRKKKKKSHHSENVRNASVSKCQENCHAESLFQGNIFLFSRIYKNLLLFFFSHFFFFHISGVQSEPWCKGSSTTTMLEKKGLCYTCHCPAQSRVPWSTSTYWTGEHRICSVPPIKTKKIWCQKDQGPLPVDIYVPVTGDQHKMCFMSGLLCREEGTSCLHSERQVK